MLDETPGEELQQQRVTYLPVVIIALTRAMELFKQRKTTSKFWIEKGLGKRVIESQPFALVIGTNTTPAERDYVRIKLQRPCPSTVMETEWMSAPHTAIKGQIVEAWEGRQIAVFPLIMRDPGIFRLKIDMMEYGGEEYMRESDKVITTLYTDNFTV